MQTVCPPVGGKSARDGSADNTYIRFDHAVDSADTDGDPLAAIVGLDWNGVHRGAQFGEFWMLEGRDSFEAIAPSECSPYSPWSPMANERPDFCCDRNDRSNGCRRS